MNDNEDLELQALQRQLDDAFETTRPRAGFEDALWSRMQTRRSPWARFSDFFSGLIDSIREAPAVPATAVAVVLIVAIGVGLVVRSGIHLGGGASTASNASAPYTGQQTGGAFGAVPMPGQPATGADVGPKYSTDLTPATVYQGPARLTWAGQLNVQVTSAPVYRYLEPTAQDADRFAIALGAAQSGQRTTGTLGDYSGSGFLLVITGTSRAPLRDPSYDITPDRSQLPPAGANPADTAAAFLSARSVFPAWPYAVAVSQTGDVVRVIYQRQFAGPNNAPVFLVDPAGERYGIEVDLRGGQPLQAIGPMPLNLESADYPIITADQAVQSALSSSTTQASAPTVRLTRAELVYALAYAGDHSFYEPAFLFSGTFTQNGVTYVKRVLVPAVVPAQRSS